MKEYDVIQRIRQFLKNKNMSVAQLSNLLDMSSSTLSGKLNGTRGLDIDTLCGILTRFPELSTEWLFRGNSESEKAIVDDELRETCVEQAKEIYRLRKQLAELVAEQTAKLA